MTGKQLVLIVLCLLVLAPARAREVSLFPATPDAVDPDGPGVAALVDAWLAAKGLDPWGRTPGTGIDLSAPPDAGGLSRSAWVWHEVEAATELRRYVWEHLPRPVPPDETDGREAEGDELAASTHDPSPIAPDTEAPEESDSLWQDGTASTPDGSENTGETQDLGAVLGDSGSTENADGATVTDDEASTGDGNSPDEDGSKGALGFRPGPPGGSLAVAWALEKAEETPNPQNEAHPTADGLQWNDWCLLFVYTAWANTGKGVPAGISGEDADASLRNFRQAGTLRPITGNVPEGCPVFWAARGSHRWGHIAIATGRLADDGSPLIVSSNSGGARPQVMTRSLTWLDRWYGSAAAGWGMIPGTP